MALPATGRQVKDGEPGEIVAGLSKEVASGHAA